MSTPQPQLFDDAGFPTNTPIASTAELISSGDIQPYKLSGREYHKHGAVSQSKLKVFAESRKLYKAIYVDHSQEYNVTPAMKLGSLVHAMTLEPEALDAEYIKAVKCDRRTNVGKAAWADFEANAGGREVVDIDMWEQAERITEAINANPVVQACFDICDLREFPHFWIDAATGAPCRCKLDMGSRSNDIVFDFKITFDVSPESIAKMIANLNYDGQAAWYSDAWRNLTGTTPNFVFIAVQKEPPYEIGFYELHEADIDTARQRNARMLAALRECEMSGEWELPHEKEIQKIRLPRFAAYRDEYKSF